MCFKSKFKIEEIPKSNPVVGYRAWRARVSYPASLMSLYRDYVWPTDIVQHEVKDSDSGIYSYNYYNNNYYYYYNYNYYYDYRIHGVIKQYGKVAIHEEGYRSEYAKVDTLFTIRESDAKGPEEFLVWIKTFNSIVTVLATKYGAKTMHWQDFIESQASDKK